SPSADASTSKWDTSPSTRRRWRNTSGDPREVTMGTSACARAARGAGILALAVAGAMIIMPRVPHDLARAQTAPVKSDFGAVARYVFIPAQNAPIVTVVDRDIDGVVGSLDVGLVPKQVVVSEATRKLVAVDGIARAVSVVDLANGRRVTIDLDFTPRWLIASPDGYEHSSANVATSDRSRHVSAH